MDAVYAEPAFQGAAAPLHAAYDAGLLIRATGDTIALCPPLIIDEPRTDEIVETIRHLLHSLN